MMEIRMVDSFFSLTTEDNFVSSFYLTKHLTFQISNRNKSNDKKVTDYRNAHNPAHTF